MKFNGRFVASVMIICTCIHALLSHYFPYAFQVPKGHSEMNNKKSVVVNSGYAPELTQVC